jgi:hypothetical protein
MMEMGNCKLCKMKIEENCKIGLNAICNLHFVLFSNF